MPVSENHLALTKDMPLLLVTLPKFILLSFIVQLDNFLEELDSLLSSSPGDGTPLVVLGLLGNNAVGKEPEYVSAALNTNGMLISWCTERVLTIWNTEMKAP